VFSIRNNQAGFKPCFTYYYIVNEKGEIYHHKDKKWRKKGLKEITTYYFLGRAEAEKILQKLEISKIIRDYKPKPKDIKACAVFWEDGKRKVIIDK